jgi:hypothetical protein
MTLDEAIKRSKDTKHIIEQAISGVISRGSTKDLIVAAYLSLAMQHHSAIIVLIENQIPSSAAALARPILEACYRGNWVAVLADIEECEKINSIDYKWSQTWDIAKQVDEYLMEQNTLIPFKIFHTIYEKNAPALNGFTHGGIQQLSRQFSEDGTQITPTFRDTELVELLNSSNTHLAMTLLAFAFNEDKHELAQLAQTLITED